METRLLHKILACCVAVAINVQVSWPLALQQVPVATVTPPASALDGQSATLLPDGNWLLLGGKGKTGAVARASIANTRSGAVTSLNYGLTLARAWHSATLLPDGTVLITGGIGADGKLVSQPEILDPQRKISYPIQSRLLQRAHHSATLMIDGRVLIAGGVSSSGTLMNTVELWDSRSQNVSVLPTQMAGASDPFVSPMPDGTILLWGGRDAHGDSLSIAQLYDPRSQSFTLTSVTMPSAPDLNLPQMETSLPNDGDTDVSPNVIIGVRFSKPLSVSSVNVRSLTLNANNTPVVASVVPAERGLLAFVTPAAPLQPGATYLLTLQGAVDGQGLSLISKTISFTIAGGPASSSGTSGNALDTGLPPAALPPLLAPLGVTAISGQVLQLNGKPLANVTLTVGSQKVLSDNTGRFLVQNVSAGHQVLVIEGRTANIGNTTYGLFEAGTDVQVHKTNILGYKIWMTPLDTAHTITIPSPTLSDTVITTPQIPGLKLILPPQTVIYDYYGHVVHNINITNVPVSQPPFPLPNGVRVPLYFTIQPGGAYLRVGGASYPRGARLIYPNSGNTLPGTQFAFWNYDADQKGWYVYGIGTTSPDRMEVIPNPGVSIYEFSGAMVNDPGPPPPKGPPPGHHPPKGDPVDPSTGLFVYQSNDAYLPDVIPINLTRVYRQGDTVSRDFGMGTSHNYEVYLVGDKNPYTYQDLILPDGGRIHYARISSGTSWTDAVYQHSTTATEFYGSTINWNPSRLPNGGWDLHFKDGSLWAFPESSSASLPQQAAILYIQDRWGNVLNIARGTNANITQITSPNGRWLQFTYDSCNRIQQLTDDIGRSTIYAYDSSNCNTSGHLHTFTDPNQGVATYNYGENGATTDEMTSIVDARLIKYLTNQYDSSGRVYLQTLANSGTFKFTYATDAFSNITQTTITDPNGYVNVINYGTPEVFQSGFQTGGGEMSEVFAQGKPEQQTFTYDRGTPANNPGGFLLNLTDPLNRVTNFNYDSLGNLINFTRLSGTSSAAITFLTYEPKFNRLASLTDALSRTTSFTYNDSSNSELITDALGNQTTFGFNSAGQTISITDPLNNALGFTYSGADLASTSDPLHNTFAFLYDGAGRTVSMTDPTGVTTAFSYDPLDDLAGITDALGHAVKFGYDPNQNLTSFTDPLHTTAPTQYMYNSMDLLQKRIDPLGNAESFSYDGNNNLTCYTDRRGNIDIFQYDGINRRSLAGFGASTCTATSYKSNISYGYDAGNRLLTATDSVAGKITRGYDLLDNITSEQEPLNGTNHTVQYLVDSVGRRQTMTVDTQPVVHYSYDNADRLLQILQGSSTIGFSYDAAGRRTSLTLPNGVTAQYSYDVASHLTGINYQVAGIGIGNLTYTYDADGRVVQKGGTMNATNVPATVASANYNSDNQLLSWGSNAYTYDANGNLQTGAGDTLVWDERNQLSSISGATTGSFEYDAFGRRINKTIGSTTTSFLYDSSNVTSEFSGSTLTATLLTGLSPDEIYNRTDSAGARYFLTDSLGSTVALTDVNGAVQTQYSYEPFGNTTASGAVSSNTYQFTGRENDGDGLYYYRARYYAPGLQRFVSEDPRGIGGGYNIYGYAGMDPINYVDPFGLARRKSPPPPPPPPPPCPPQICNWPPPPPPPPCPKELCPPPPPKCQNQAGYNAGDFLCDSTLLACLAATENPLCFLVWTACQAKNSADHPNCH
jgi:RHS repeat-associated protein